MQRDCLPMGEDMVERNCEKCGTLLAETGAPIWETYCPNDGCTHDRDKFAEGMRQHMAANRARERVRDAAPELLAALLEIIGPLNACSDNPNVRDDVCLPVDMTMGELRKARAAITAALGGEGR